MNSPFKFKQFELQQDRCAMKVGTDGVLLGAWVNLSNQPESILDVGAGTGILALMLAQRSCAELIDALEIDEEAYEQCIENFEASPWGDRLFCYHASFQEFVSEIDESYDLIISNPPFFTETPNAHGAARNQARFSDALPFEHLIIGATHLLNDQGTLAVILPYKEEPTFSQLAESHGLHPKRICHVQGTPTSPVKRVLMEFSFYKATPKSESMVIETERHVYTEEYRCLVKDFYLKM